MQRGTGGDSPLALPFLGAFVPWWLAETFSGVRIPTSAPSIMDPAGALSTAGAVIVELGAGYTSNLRVILPMPFLDSTVKVSETLLLWFAGLLLLMAALAILGRVPLAYNLRNLLVRWRTSLLTALAFTLVVCLLTVMMAFVNGMEKLTEQSGQPGNVIVFSDGATDESFSSLGFQDSADVARVDGVLRDPATDEPRASRETYVIVTQPLDATPGSKDFNWDGKGPPPKARRRFLQVRGIESPEMAGYVHKLELSAGGRWFSEAGVSEVVDDKTGEKVSAIEAVLGSGIAQELGGDRGPGAGPVKAGETFRVGERLWLCVGVLKMSGSTFDSEVWGKRALVGPIYGKDQFTTLVLRTADAEAARKVASYIKTDYKKANLDAQVETDYFGKLTGTTQQFTYAISFVAVTMAIGGMFGIMNTMFAAIAQRTKDIGVLRIVGFARNQVLISFLLESMVLALVGGLMGCAIGSFADGWTAKSIVSSGPGGGGGKFVVLQLDVDLEIMLTGLVISLLMGLVGGLLPALSAMRLRPLESMR
jgi:putative ABC transport system permease protein